MSSARDRSKEVESAELRARRKAIEAEPAREEPAAQATLSPAAGAQALTDPRFAPRANLPLKAQALHGLQRTHGNAAVQRLMAQDTQRRQKKEVPPQLAERIERSRSGGQPLEPKTRAEMEPRFGRDLGSVRVHSGATADYLARGLSAKAFTVGHDIFVPSGAYQPDTLSGKRLLAHEVTHVVQGERGAAPPSRAVSQPSDAAEQEATTVAAALTAKTGIAPAVDAAPSAVIQREDEVGGMTSAEAPMSVPGEAASTAEYVEFEYEGVLYRMTPAERDALVQGLIKKLKPLASQVKGMALSASSLYDHFVQLNDEQYVVSWFAEALGGAEMPAKTLISDALESADKAIAAAAGTDLAAAIDAVTYAERVAIQAANAMNEYQEGVIGGAGTSITILEVVRDVSFATVGVLGGAALAAPIAAATGLAAGSTGLAVTTAAVSGGGTALLKSVAGSTGEAIAFGGITWGEAIDKAILDTLGGAVGGAAGAGIAAKLAGPVVTALYSRFGATILSELGEEAAKELIKSCFEGGVGGAISGSIGKLASEWTSATTWDKVLEDIVKDLVSGTIQGCLKGKLPDALVAAGIAGGTKAAEGPAKY